jgi:hypothetical protein
MPNGAMQAMKDWLQWTSAGNKPMKQSREFYILDSTPGLFVCQP